jgi:hypothetical protein
MAIDTQLRQPTAVLPPYLPQQVSLKSNPTA